MTTFPLEPAGKSSTVAWLQQVHMHSETFLARHLYLQETIVELLDDETGPPPFGLKLGTYTFLPKLARIPNGTAYFK